MAIFRAPVFIKDFFSDTMPLFKVQVAAACINVDLVRSTKDCYKNLYPLLSPGGIISFLRMRTFHGSSSFWTVIHFGMTRSA